MTIKNKYLTGSHDVKVGFSILTDDKNVEIEIKDNYGTGFQGKLIIPINLFMKAFAQRLVGQKCIFHINNLDKIGLEYIREEITCEIPDTYDNRKENAIKYIIEATPDGWIPCLYFDSQGSFYRKEDKLFAKTTMIKWIEQ